MSSIWGGFRLKIPFTALLILEHKVELLRISNKDLFVVLPQYMLISIHKWLFSRVSSKPDQLVRDQYILILDFLRREYD